MLPHLKETVILIPPREPQPLYLGNTELSYKELTFVHIVKKFPVICGSAEFIAFFTRVLHTKQVGWSRNAPGIDFEGYPFQIWPLHRQSWHLGMLGQCLKLGHDRFLLLFSTYYALIQCWITRGPRPLPKWRKGPLVTHDIRESNRSVLCFRNRLGHWSNLHMSEWSAVKKVCSPLL